MNVTGKLARVIDAMRDRSGLDTTAALDTSTKEYELFSTGAAKKLTVIGQQSSSPIGIFTDACSSEFLTDLSQCSADLLSGQCSDSEAAISYDWQYATQTAPPAFKHTNAITKAARNFVLSGWLAIRRSISNDRDQGCDLCHRLSLSRGQTLKRKFTMSPSCMM